MCGHKNGVKNWQKNHETAKIWEFRNQHAACLEQFGIKSQDECINVRALSVKTPYDLFWFI